MCLAYNAAPYIREALEGFLVLASRLVAFGVVDAALLVLVFVNAPGDGLAAACDSNFPLEEEIDACFTLEYYFKNVDYIFKRVGIYE